MKFFWFLETKGLEAKGFFLQFDWSYFQKGLYTLNLQEEHKTPE